MKMQIEEYLKARSINLSENTVYRLRVELNDLKNYLQKEKLSYWNEVTPEILTSFLEMKSKRLKPISLKGKVCTIKGFMDYLYKEGYYLSHPFKEFVKVKSNYFPRFTPSQQMVEDLLANACLGVHFLKRNQAIIELSYSSGLRRKELRSLDVDDVNGEYLKIIGKRNEERLVPLGDKTRARIIEYITGERVELEAKSKGERALFLSRFGNRISLVALSNLIVPKAYHQRLTLHSFRHAFATHMLENGASSEYIRQMLGHKRLSTTQIYTEVCVLFLQKTLLRRN
jgi:site-specific recombinase XerD